MKQSRIYLDTSVLSAVVDARAPDRQMLTKGFFVRYPKTLLSTSELTVEELGATRDADKRSELLALLDSIGIFPLTDEMRELADHYVREGVFSEIQRNDALHVAAAIVDGYPILVSWNFRHLVNRQRRLRIQAVNASLLLPGIEILSPPEV